MSISEKTQEYQKRWRANNAERMKAYQRIYQHENHDRLREYDRTKRDSLTNYETHGRKHHLRRKYGITIEEYDRLFAAQGGKCALCKTDDPGKGKRHFHIDHDHLSGKVRGLLCVKCNMGIGSFSESTSLMFAAGIYIQEHREGCDPNDYEA